MAIVKNMTAKIHVICTQGGVQRQAITTVKLTGQLNYLAIRPALNGFDFSQLIDVFVIYTHANASGKIPNVNQTFQYQIVP